MPSIQGFVVDWAAPNRVLASREASPKHGYEFEVSADWQRIVKLISTSPDDVSDGDPEEDAVRFEREAGKAVNEFLRRRREGG